MSKTITITYYDYTCGDCRKEYTKTTYLGSCAKCNTNLCRRCDKTTICSSCTKRLTANQTKKVKVIRRRTMMLSLYVAYFGIMLLVIGLLPWGVDLIDSLLIIPIIIGGLLVGFLVPMLHFFVLKDTVRKRLRIFFTG